MENIQIDYLYYIAVSVEENWTIDLFGFKRLTSVTLIFRTDALTDIGDGIISIPTQGAVRYEVEELAE